MSVTSVCSALPGPLLVTLTVQTKGWRSATEAALALLATARSMRWRTLVCSSELSLPGKLSGSLATTVATLR